MSTTYDYEIEVSSKEEFSMHGLRRLVYTGGLVTKYGASWETYKAERGISPFKVKVYGQTSLFGGETTEEAHQKITEEIQKRFPDVKVVSRWHYASFDWDDEFGEEEES